MNIKIINTGCKPVDDRSFMGKIFPDRDKICTALERAEEQKLSDAIIAVDAKANNTDGMIDPVFYALLDFSDDNPESDLSITIRVGGDEKETQEFPAKALAEYLQSAGFEVELIAAESIS